jgi:hypothetical protein
MHIRMIWASDKAKPRKDIPDRFLEGTHWWLEAIATCATIAFLGMYIIPWSFPYPEPVEKLLWRITSVYFAASGTAATFWLLGWSFASFSPREPKILPISSSDAGSERPLSTWRKYRTSLRIRAHNFAERLRNITPEKDPYMTVPLRFILPPTIFAVGHLLCRGYMIVEDFAQLRSLPPDTYQTVDWSHYYPHL